MVAVAGTCGWDLWPGLVAGTGTVGVVFLPLLRHCCIVVVVLFLWLGLGLAGLCRVNHAV